MSDDFLTDVLIGAAIAAGASGGFRGFGTGTSQTIVHGPSADDIAEAIDRANKKAEYRKAKAEATARGEPWNEVRIVCD